MRQDCDEAMTSAGSGSGGGRVAIVETLPLIAEALLLIAGERRLRGEDR